MPADYLSRLPSSQDTTINEVTEGFDPFQADLHDLQKEDKQLQNMNNFRVSGKWLHPIPKERLIICKTWHQNFSRTITN
jgi:hypothetical protein